MLGQRWDMVGGQRMHTRVGDRPAGDAPTVVLVHGLSISSRYMVSLARHLVPEIRVLAPDLPGFGLSDKPPAVLDIPGLAAALVAWMDVVGLTRVTLVGNSIGCQVVIEVGLRWPERVGGLVLTGLAVGLADKGLVQLLLGGLRDIPREPISLWPLQAIDFAAAGPRRVLATFRHALRDRVDGKLSHLLPPTLILHGTADPFVSWERLAALAGALPSGRLVAIEGGAHAVHFGRPAEVAREIQKFIAETCAGA